MDCNMTERLSLLPDDKGYYCIYYGTKLVGKGKTLAIATKNASKYFKGQNL